jgi:hypothetical protein
MKHLVALAALFLTVSAFADSAPPISARQALDIAEKNMNERGIGKDVYIVSVTFTHDSLLGGEAYWFVKWSHPIPATDQTKREVGIKVRMDGAATRLVKGFGQP